MTVVDLVGARVVFDNPQLLRAINWHPLQRTVYILLKVWLESLELAPTVVGTLREVVVCLRHRL